LSAIVDDTAAFRGSRLDLSEVEQSVIAQGVEGRLVPQEQALAEEAGREYESGESLVERILEERGAERHKS
jgi:type I restriction enzyme S subunit